MYNRLFIKCNKHTIRKMLISFFIILTVIQQMPIIRDVYYKQVRLLLYLGFGIFSLLSIFNFPRILKHKFTIYFSLCIIYFMMLLFATGISNIACIFQLIVPFGILLCSLNTSFTRKYLENILTIYIILSAILGVSLIFYYGEGFKITQNYFLIGKNQIGPLLGISVVIVLYRLFNTYIDEYSYRNKKQVLINIILFFIIVSSIIVIRNRSGMVGIIIVTIFITLKKLSNRLNLRNFVIIQLLLIVLFILVITGHLKNILGPIWAAFSLNYDITDLNSLSAGRINVYKSAISYALKYPILGELGTADKFYAVPHNYVLDKWVRYGIIGSFPIIIFYCYLWHFSFKGLKEKKDTLALLVLLFSLIVSIFEYTYPYGPGISQLMVWFLLGQHLKKSN